jgi:hypothetical protein
MNPYLHPAFYGRDDDPQMPGGNAELLYLLEYLHNARDEGQGALLQVRGNAGVGKTRLLQEFGCRALQEACGAVYVSVTECIGNDPLAVMLKTISRRLLNLDPEHRGQKRPAGLGQGLKAVASKVADLGISAGSAIAATGQLWGLATLPMGLGLKGLIGHATDRAQPGPIPDEPLPVFCDALEKLNADLHSADEETAVAIVIDQWDDILRKDLDQQRLLKEALEAVVQTLVAGMAQSGRIVLAIGVRNERAAVCLPPRHALSLSSLDVTPLREEVATELLLCPEGEGINGGYFTQEAAQRLAAEYCATRASPDTGDLAALLAVAGTAVMQAQRRTPSLLPINEACYDDLVAKGIKDLVGQAHRAFLDHAQHTKTAEGFVAALLAEEWDHIDPDRIAARLPDEVERPQVIDWLQWWARETTLLAGSESDTGIPQFRFRHESYRDALAQLVHGDRADALRKAQHSCREAVRLLADKRPEDVPIAFGLLARISPDMWQSLAAESQELLETLSTILENGDLQVRQATVDALAESERAWGVGPLTTALRDDDGDVRWHAAEALPSVPI